MGLAESDSQEKQAAKLVANAKAALAASELLLQPAKWLGELAERLFVLPLLRSRLAAISKYTAYSCLCCDQQLLP